ncbi:dUTPase [Cotia virus SPAn232]|uniref:Deoxyuridine 5'-triphosphate nucleotidohydrolase n=2 Tax=Cotia virus TaxID=39444 RepID=H6TAI8_9POXV|nr:dUTPase [Cotia virus SPAn232]AFB76925.1 deoxyuridine 5'-triphosphate nucleotidohydrolase [Cotia virus SPAn232]AIT70650.1 deoxyuridine 5'-triphosphate nucleotidohydrolase [Cotia virus]
MESVKCVLLSNNGYIPTKSTPGSAGFDLYSAYDYEISPLKRILVKTDIMFDIPEGCYGRIAARSGLSLNKYIDIGGGVIDRDYRGNIGIIVINNGESTFYISKGERVAQIIFEKYFDIDILQCDNINFTERGNKGFGSSGK